jgi:hypothetical protein
LGTKGRRKEKVEILCGFQKCVDLLRQEVPKAFFSETRFFAKFSKCLKNQFFCQNVFPYAKLKTSTHKRYKPYNILKTPFYKLGLGFQDQTKIT